MLYQKCDCGLKGVPIHSYTLLTRHVYQVHTFVELRDYKGPFLPGFIPITDKDPLAYITPNPKLEFVDHVVGESHVNLLTTLSVSHT